MSIETPNNNEQESHNENELLCPEIAQEIADMYAVDQAMRERAEKEHFWDDTVDAKNTGRMKEIVDKIGWPTISKVGVEGSENAWLLVQHADHDVQFQELCLSLMEKEPVGEVSRRNIAMLTDRIRVNSGRGQVYGTQFEQRAGKHVPRSIEEPEYVNERRASMGLGTLEEGIQEMYEKYGIPESGEDEKH